MGCLALSITNSIVIQEILSKEFGAVLSLRVTRAACHTKERLTDSVGFTSKVADWKGWPQELPTALLELVGPCQDTVGHN